MIKILIFRKQITGKDRAQNLDMGQCLGTIYYLFNQVLIISLNDESNFEDGVENACDNSATVALKANLGKATSFQKSPIYLLVVTCQYPLPLGLKKLE